MSSFLRFSPVFVIVSLAGANAADAQPAAKSALKVRASQATGVARFVTAADGGAVPVPIAPGKAAGPAPRDFFTAHGRVFGIQDPGAELALHKVQADALGQTHTTFQQVYKGVPVFAGIVRVHQDAAGAIRAVNGTFIPNIAVDPAPRLTDAEARRAALAAARRHHGAGQVVNVTASRLVIFRTNLVRGIPGTNHLAYEVEVSDGAAIRDLFFIDAHKGGIIDRIQRVCDLDRRVYDGGVDDPFLVWSEGDATPFGVPDIDNLINYSAHAFNLYANATEGEYLSFDGVDGTMHAAVNNVGSCPNANWNGTSTNYCAGVTPDDVVGHEWTHAYTEYTSGLIYQWQSGALNESYSDIFGEIIDMLNGSGTDAPAPIRAAGGCSSFGSSIPPNLEITAPPAVAGEMTVAGAQFNPAGPLTATAPVQFVNDGDDEGGDGTTTDGCQSFIGFTAGRIALIDRGGCPFTDKVANAEDAGADGVIIVNNQGDDVFSMSGGTSPAIPSVMIGQSNGDLLKAHLTGLAAVISLEEGTDPSYRWLTGEDSSSFGGAIRDMWNPSCFGDPGKVTDALYVCGTGDNGGVHSNSGIPNHAFALIVDGGTYNGFTITGLGLTKAFHIYWRAQSVYQVPSTDFADHADALEQSCADLIGINLEGLSTTSVPAGPSGAIITAGNCAELSEAIDAVQLREPPAQCGFTPLLDPNNPQLCGSGVILMQDWESGMGAWTAGTRDVADALTFDTPDWAVVSDLPDDQPGSAAFVADLVIGNCNDDLETGVLFLESPPVVIPAIADDQIVLGFDHWIATEQNFDGGNLKIDVNGDGFGLVPSSAFIFNPYNTSLNPMPDNDNPMAGEEAFTGSNPGSVTGSWGQSQVNLTGLVLPGDTLRIRFEMGLDGCNGVQGWYIDTIALQYCAPCEDSDGDGYGVPGNAVCPAGAAEDCDDGDPDNHPGNAEVCDGLDNNCDTLADNAAECCPGGALTECSDVNDDGIRDDNCVWWSCELGGCSGIDVVFSDIGGQFGACPPDGAADGNDRFHALNCFSDINTLGAAPYLCEENPPVAFNVDAGGQFGQCCPDGVCDGNDAFHALNAFAGVSPCECPRNFVCPCPVPTDPPQNPVLCPDGPSPGLPPDSAGTRVVGTAEIRLSAGRRAVRPGGLIEVVALVENSLADLRGYQLHVAAVGGKRGHLELVDVAVEQRGDHVFAGHGDWRAFNVHTAQMVAGLDSAGLATRPGAYLATFTFRASADASGTFVVDLLHDASDSGQRTFLFPTPVGAKIAVGATTPARVTVQP